MHQTGSRANILNDYVEKGSDHLSDESFYRRYAFAKQELVKKDDDEYKNKFKGHKLRKNRGWCKNAHKPFVQITFDWVIGVICLFLAMIEYEYITGYFINCERFVRHLDKITYELFKNTTILFFYMLKPILVYMSTRFLKVNT